MENASKALLIAGSILIVILLISVGMKIFNSTSETSDQVGTTMQTTEIAVFNSKFSKYIGNSVSSSKVKSFLNEVIVNNAMASDSSGTFSPQNHQIYINFYNLSGTRTHTHVWKSNDINDVMENINSSSKYKIYVSNCDTYPGGYFNGYIICIDIATIS